MAKKIQVPKKFNKAPEPAKREVREYLCNYAVCDADIVVCEKCAFYSNENFDKFIKQAGL